MIAWFRALSGWKLWLLVISGTAAISLSTGFMAGKKWEESEQVRDLRSQLVELDKNAKKAIMNLNNAWAAQFEKAQVLIAEWREQSKKDKVIIDSLLSTQEELRKEYAELYAQYNNTTDFGYCVLSPDAIRLLHSASASRRFPAALPERDD